MKPLSTSFIAFFFTFLSAMPVLLTVGVLIGHHHAEKKMTGKFQQQLLVTLSLTREKIQWVKEGKELLIEGKLFDVAYLHENNGYLEVIGLFDTEEDILIAKYSSLLNEGDENSMAVLLLKMIFTPFVEPNRLIGNSNFSAIANAVFVLFEENTTTGHYPIHIPPPKTAAFS